MSFQKFLITEAEKKVCATMYTSLCKNLQSQIDKIQKALDSDVMRMSGNPNVSGMMNKLQGNLQVACDTCCQLITAISDRQESEKLELPNKKKMKKKVNEATTFQGVKININDIVKKMKEHGFDMQNLSPIELMEVMEELYGIHADVGVEQNPVKINSRNNMKEATTFRGVKINLNDIVKEMKERGYGENDWSEMEFIEVLEDMYGIDVQKD